MVSDVSPSVMQRVVAALFFGAFLLAGCAVLVSLTRSLVIREWRASHRFVEAQCTVLDKRVVEHVGHEGPSYRPEFRVRYAVAGKTHELWTYEAAKISAPGRAYSERILEEFTVGQQYPCWYDPDDPGSAVLVRGTSWFLYLFLLIPLASIAAGGAGIWFVICEKAGRPQQSVPTIKAKAGSYGSAFSQVDPVAGPLVGRHPH